MSAHTDVARMLTLVPWLLERPGASHREIASAFGVDEATIRRDLGHLDFCGLPGLGGGDLFEVATVGDRVVLRMADELKRPLRPTAREALRLVLTLDAVTEALGDEVPALRSAVAKVRAALGIPERAAEVVEPDETAALDLLRYALQQGRRVRLTYQGRTDASPSERLVDPWALHLRDGTWYLQGHDQRSGERRVFRMDRVVAADVLDEPVRVAAPEVLEPPRYVPRDDDLQAEVVVTPRGRWLLDALAVDEVVDSPDGGARIRLRTDAPAWLARLVVMAGGEARVVQPSSLVELVAQEARDALAAYQPA